MIGTPTMLSAVKAWCAPVIALVSIAAIAGTCDADCQQQLESDGPAYIHGATSWQGWRDRTKCLSLASDCTLWVLMAEPCCTSTVLLDESRSAAAYCNGIARYVPLREMRGDS